jgi:hypothetical protein
MLDTKHSRNADGELTISSPNGVAVVSRTLDVGVADVRPWTLHINGQFQDTFDSEDETISAAHEILALKP